MLNLGIKPLSLPCSPFDPIGLPRWAAFRTFLGLARLALDAIALRRHSSARTPLLALGSGAPSLTRVRYDLDKKDTNSPGQTKYEPPPSRPLT